MGNRLIRRRLALFPTKQPPLETFAQRHLDAPRNATKTERRGAICPAPSEIAALPFLLAYEVS